MVKVGVLVLPPLNPVSIPLIKQGTRNVKVLSNYAIPVPHRMLKIEAEPETKVFGDTTIRIDKSKVKLDITDMTARHLVLLMEMKKHTDKLLVVAPTKFPVLIMMIAMKEFGKGNVKLIVGDKHIRDKEYLDVLANIDKTALKLEWDRITNPESVQVPVTKKYEPHELTNTPSGATLRPYQQQMMDFAMTVKRVGLFVDMGLGKTLATLATIDKLVADGKLDPTKPVLIVAPIMVALDTWSREADKWGYDMDVLINIKLTPKKREALFDKLLEPQEKLTLLTTNPAQLKSMHEYFQSKHLRAPFQAVIVDELSQFKSPTAQRFDYLSKLTAHSEYFFGLTGTPAPNDLLDVWSQMIVIDKENSGYFGYDFFQYRGRYFQPDTIGRDGTVYTWKLKPGAEDEIFSRMKHSVISMRSEGLIDLPDIIHDKRYVTLPPKARKQYDHMDKVLRYQLMDKDDDEEITMEVGGVDVRLPNSAVLQGKLAQLTSGAMYDNIETTGDAVGHYEVFHDEKFKMLKDIVESATSPILVFFNFQSELDRIGDYIDYVHLNPKDQDNVQSIISQWNNGEIPVLLAHPASAGHGLNLQDGGHTIVWLTTTWSNEQYRQAVKRLYRSGQENTVSNIHIVVENSVDDEIIDRVNAKEVGQNRLMEALDTADRGS